jgi:hypothetical protein
MEGLDWLQHLMQLQIVFPGEYVQGTLFPKQDSNFLEDWKDCTFLNH